jgi:dolichol-phosphate mannosyltransferase
MDADLQHPPEIIPQIIFNLQQGADIVIPCRFMPGGSDGGLNIGRKLISWVARSLGHLMIKKIRPIADCTSGYFGLQRNVIEGVPLTPTSWKILLEIIVKGNTKLIHEIPYQFVARDSGASKMDWREQWYYICHIMQLARYHK